MRVYNPQTDRTLLPELRGALERLRKRRGFDAGRYITAKAVVLNDYMRQSRLNACVVAVSGGVDSAVVSGLAARAKALPNSPIQKIVPVLMPIFDVGATHQGEATVRGQETAQALGLSPVVVDLSAAHGALKTAVDTSLDVLGEPWASGQLVSYARTPALYYITSLLTQQGYSPILLGTTNRDEGSYLGFIGKASDAMVDVQMISDLHKSEVYKAAELLGVPSTVLTATPTGDMYDARPDEEVFGAPYDFVELYLLYKDLSGKAERTALQNGWPVAAREQFDFFARNLEELHRYNRHKYLGRSPAVHLDIQQASTPDGWNNSLYLALPGPPVDTSRINGLFELDPEFTASLLTAPDPEVETDTIPGFGDRNLTQRHKVSQEKTILEAIPGFDESALILRHIFRPEEIEAMRAQLQNIEWIPVGINGMRKDFQPDSDVVGSWRATAYSPDFAHVLWNRIGGAVGNPKMANPLTTDGDGTPVWRAVGVNPLLRFIRYKQGGALIPHYDAPFVYHEGKRTLVSLLLYISPGDGRSGATRLIRDPQAHVPVVERNLDDWPRFAAADEVLFAVPPEAGTCLLLDHRLLHDAEACEGTEEKILLRTDLVFERCGTVPSHV